MILKFEERKVGDTWKVFKYLQVDKNTLRDLYIFNDSVKSISLMRPMTSIKVRESAHRTAENFFVKETISRKAKLATVGLFFYYKGKKISASKRPRAGGSGETMGVGEEKRWCVKEGKNLAKRRAMKTKERARGGFRISGHFSLSACGSSHFWRNFPRARRVFYCPKTDRYRDYVAHRRAPEYSFCFLASLLHPQRALLSRCLLLFFLSCRY